MLRLQNMRLKRSLFSWIFVCGVIVAFTSMTSCNKVAKTTKFDLEFNGLAVIQDTFQVGLPYDIFTPSLATHSQSIFATKKTDNDHIESIRLTELDLSVSNPPGEVFEALDSIGIYMSAPGLAEVTLASKTNIFIYATTIEFEDFTTSDLQAYLKKDKILFRIRVYLDNQPAQNLTVNLHATFHVDAREVQK